MPKKIDEVEITEDEKKELNKFQEDLDNVLKSVLIGNELNKKNITKLKKKVRKVVGKFFNLDIGDVGEVFVRRIDKETFVVQIEKMVGCEIGTPLTLIRFSLNREE